MLYEQSVETPQTWNPMHSKDPAPLQTLCIPMYPYDANSTMCDCVCMHNKVWAPGLGMTQGA